MEYLEELKREIFNWAAESGQELVAIEISRMWFRLGGNTGSLKLHQIEDNAGGGDVVLDMADMAAMRRDVEALG